MTIETCDCPGAYPSMGRYETNWTNSNSFPKEVPFSQKGTFWGAASTTWDLRSNICRCDL